MAKAAERESDWRWIVDEIDWTRVKDRFGLSSRELQVVQNTLEGKSMAEIAERLDLAVGTVKTYSGRIHAKLRVKNQCQLTLVVLHESLNGRPETAEFGPRRWGPIRRRAAN